MAEHHFEQEELERLKDWWKRYGSFISLFLTILGFAIAGWRGWGWYQERQSREAAEIYDRVVLAAGKADLPSLKQESGSLFEQYPQTSYAPLAAMLSAKQHGLAGDFKTAATLLRWVIDRSSDEGLVSIARLRLAAVLLDDGKAAEALEVVDAIKPARAEANDAFNLSRLDRRGDVLHALGRIDEAVKTWDEALGKADEEPGWKQLLQIKRDHAATSSGKSS